MAASPIEATPPLAKIGSSRRSRHRGGRRRVPLLHPGHGGRVAFVLPSSDIAIRPPPLTSVLRRDAAGIVPLDDDDDGGDDDALATELPTLCPSCLPPSDPHFVPTCHRQGDNEEPCPMEHASLSNATRFDVHRRGTTCAVGDSNNTVSNNNSNGIDDDEDEPRYVDDGPDAESALVAVAMPNHRAGHEYLLPSTCLVTKANLHPPKPKGHDDPDKTNNDDGGTAPSLPQHCAHWLQRGVCVYGRTCQFVHCVEPSQTAVHGQRDHWHATALAAAIASNAARPLENDEPAAISEGRPTTQAQKRPPSPPPAGGIHISAAAAAPVMASADLATAPHGVGASAGVPPMSATRLDASMTAAPAPPFFYSFEPHQHQHQQQHFPVAYGNAPPGLGPVLPPVSGQAWALPFPALPPPPPPPPLPPPSMVAAAAPFFWPYPHPMYHHQQLPTGSDVEQNDAPSNLYQHQHHFPPPAGLGP